ncbi:MAG TPA: carboxypeptidase-like regulatory domain-containing protein [Thermoanaerobaculia bacterium]|nr:carboxypeptidase-like regulatory domain-containing protein [Thermoanaerobaculia bacterium]
MRGQLAWWLLGVCLIGLSWAPGELAAQPVAGPEIRGAVRAPGGEPAAGARLELRPWAPSHQRRLAELGRASIEPVASVLADARGRFAIRAPDVGAWQLVAIPEDGPEIALRFLPLIEDQEAGTIELREARTLQVVVRGADGTAIEGALVVADAQRPRVRGGDRFPPWPQRQTSRTDAQGRAVLAVASGLDQTVHAVAEGFLLHSERTGASRLEVTLEAAPAAVLEVRDASGRPAVGAVVHEGEELIPRGVTDERGRASVPASAEPREIQVESADLGSARVEPPAAAVVAAAETPPVVAATLKPAVTVHGAVVDRSTGDPIGGALVWSARRAEDVVETSPEGRFALTTWSDANGVPLMAGAARYSTGWIRIRTAELGVTEPTIALEPAGVISGTVMDPEGEPIPGVELVTGARESGSNTNTVGTLSREDGSYRLTGLRHGQELDLRAKHSEYALLWVDLPVLSRERPTAILDLQLDPGLVARGVVVDEGERPVEGARAFLWPRPLNDLPPWRLQTWRRFETASATSDAEGRFRFTQVPDGVYDLELKREGYATAEVPGIPIGSIPISSDDAPTGDGPVEIGRGPVAITVRAEGYAARTLELVLAGRLVQEVRLDRGGTLRVIVPGLDFNARGWPPPTRPPDAPKLRPAARRSPARSPPSPTSRRAPCAFASRPATGRVFEAVATVILGETVEAIASEVVP